MCPSTRSVPHPLPHSRTNVRDPRDTSQSCLPNHVNAGHHVVYEQDLTHVTVYRWVQRFTPLLIDAARPCRHAPGDRWFVDETYLKVAGRWVYLYRAIDQFGQVIDVFVAEKRDLAATRRFFTRALEHSPLPAEVSTDRAPAYPRVLDELLPSSWSSMQITRSNRITAA